MQHILRLIPLAYLSAFSQFGLSEQIAVTTYVTRVQEERQTTRWTLTEWLRIKERMKIMDVWLAMFNDPAKDRFSPELNISVLTTRANLDLQSGETETTSGEPMAGHTARAQLWMTNLVSTTTGIRTLNLDLGAEAGQHVTGDVGSESLTRVGQSAQTNWYTLNLRLFGRNIQDTSLVVKYGAVQTQNALLIPSEISSLDTFNQKASSAANGTMSGVELQVYVLKWLGGEATYHKYSPTKTTLDDHLVEGQYAEALGFIEVSLLRLSFGRYEERWTANWYNNANNVSTESVESGYLAGLKLQI